MFSGSRGLSRMPVLGRTLVVERITSRADGGSLLVEAETVGECGRFAATGDSELGEDVGDVKAGGLLGDEQRLADLPVGPAGSHQGEHFGLAVGKTKRC